jgi:hypothetical protein
LAQSQLAFFSIPLASHAALVHSPDGLFFSSWYLPHTSGPISTRSKYRHMTVEAHTQSMHRQYTRSSPQVAPDAVKIDFNDAKYVGRVFLYIMMGLLDAMWQTAAYWLMGAMSNDPAKLAYFTGFYKSIQSAGAAGVWRADAVSIPFMSIFASTWALLAAGLLFMLPMIYMRVHDHQEEIVVTIGGTEQVVSKEVSDRL